MLQMFDELLYDCYSVYFTIPPKGDCEVCEHYQECKEMFEIQCEEEDELEAQEEWE